MSSIDETLEKIKDLKTDLSSDIVLQKEESHEAIIIEEMGAGHGMATWDYASGDSHVRQRFIDKPQITKSQLAKSELERLYDFSSEKRIRKAAGEALGYSCARRFAHEHKIITAIIGLSSLATGAIIAYNILSQSR